MHTHIMTDEYCFLNEVIKPIYYETIRENNTLNAHPVIELGTAWVIMVNEMLSHSTYQEQYPFLGKILAEHENYVKEVTSQDNVYQSEELECYLETLKYNKMGLYFYTKALEDITYQALYREMMEVLTQDYIINYQSVVKYLLEERMANQEQLEGDLLLVPKVIELDGKKYVEVVLYNQEELQNFLLEMKQACIEISHKAFETA